MESTDQLRIGEFARLGGVSTKALRLYASIGLLRPAAVHPTTRYRLYTRAQLPDLHRLLLLKSAGFTLAEIRRTHALATRTSLQQVRARLLERADDIQRALAAIDAEIASASRVVVKHLPILPVWSRRDVIDSYDEADTLLHDLGRELPTTSRFVAGAVWHHCGARSGRIDCEVFWFSPRRTRATAPGALGAATVASILHEGDESSIGMSYDAMHRWLRDGAYRVVGPNRELYLDGSLTEIQFPISSNVS